MKENNGLLSDDILDDVFKTSRDKKYDYYLRCLKGLELLERVSIFSALFENENKNGQTIGFDIQSDFEKNPMIKNAQKMFQNVIHRGILQIQSSGSYHIPIPSLRTWMLQEYQVYLKLLNQSPSFKV